MNHNSQNNYPWQLRLDALDDVPGEILPDKEKAWVKLRQCLSGKQQPYWAAAAVLFVLMAMPATWQEPVIAPLAGEQVGNKELILQQAAAINPPAPEHPEATKVRAVKTPPTVSLKPIAPLHNDSMQTAVAGPAVDSTGLSSTPLVKLQEPESPKLKIVHINELPEPRPPSSAKNRRPVTDPSLTGDSEREHIINFVIPN